MADEVHTLRGIKDVFYETRVLRGRDFTLRRFAEEVMGGSVDPVMLGYIEKGQRFPSESLVRRLAAVRKQDPRELLALLARDRMVYAIGKELRRTLHATRDVPHVDDAELAVLVSQAIAALPDDGSWISLAKWRKQAAQAPDKRSRQAPASADRLDEVERLLRERGLAEVRAGKIRRCGRHYKAEGPQERWALAIQFATLFAKGLLDKLTETEDSRGTYLRNHFLNIEAERLPEFQEQLERSLRALAEEFAADASKTTKFLNILVNATPLSEK